MAWPFKGTHQILNNEVFHFGPLCFKDVTFHSSCLCFWNKKYKKQKEHGHATVVKRTFFKIFRTKKFKSGQKFHLHLNPQIGQFNVTRGTVLARIRKGACAFSIKSFRAFHCSRSTSKEFYFKVNLVDHLPVSSKSCKVFIWAFV